MAQHNKARLVCSYANNWDMLHELIATLLLSTQEDTHLARDCANSNKCASHPRMG